MPLRRPRVLPPNVVEEHADLERPARRRLDMVHWFDPSILLATGVEVLISAALGQRSDYRTMEDVGSTEVFRYDGPAYEQDGLWFDFLADTADGWYPTFAVASLVAQPALVVGERALPRGRFLVIGGDLVYPVASVQNYEERFTGPFEAAFPESNPSPDLFAIPGNHDWYDGLVSFSRRFTQRRWVGGWATCQRRSYFALQLPERWWLWALDVQLESDIDLGQRNYFEAVAAELASGDRVILLSHEPEWLTYDIADRVHDSNLGFLQEKIIKPRGAEVYLWLAGHLHHYRRHERVDDARYQRITSGGGGAYLHPTHQCLLGPSSSGVRRTIRIGTGRSEERYDVRRTFPSPATSFRLSLLNTLFLLKNWRFGAVSAVAYAALTWGLAPTRAPRIGMELVPWLIEHPARLVWILLVLAACVFYADEDFVAFRWFGGLAHGLAHVVCAAFIAYWATLAVPVGPWAPVSRLALIALGGALAGPIIMGLYLLVAADVFGAHPDHAFAALRIENYKHFLRLHITKTGSLEIFPIGIDRIPHAEGRAQYHLIEEPVVIEPGGARRPAGGPAASGSRGRRRGEHSGR